MRRGKKLLLNTLLLTATSLLMRAIGISFQAYLSGKIGTNGIGLFQLVLSASGLTVTFATSGVRFATIRLVSEELGMNNQKGVLQAVNRCLAYALSFGAAAAVLLYFSAGYIGSAWVGDERAVTALKILSMSLPFIALSSVLGGYFTAVTRVLQTAAVQFIEQLIRIGVVVLALTHISPNNLEQACASIVIGSVTGEIASFFIMLVLYAIDKRRYQKREAPGKNLLSRLLKTALPLAFSAYARSALSTLEHMLVPRGLKKSGASAQSSLSSYGLIHGMVLPVIFFPSSLFYSLSELLIPLVTEAQVSRRVEWISNVSNRVLKLCLMSAIGIAGIFFFYAAGLGQAIYHSAEAGYYIKIFAPLVVIMYMDAVTDGFLKGLGQQMYSMGFNILDSLCSVILVYFLLPKYAVTAYVCILYFTECFNFSLSIGRLSRLVTLKSSLLYIVRPLFCIFGAVNLVTLVLRYLGLPLAASGLSLFLHIALTLVFYFFLLSLLSCITKKEVRWIITVLK